MKGVFLDIDTVDRGDLDLGLLESTLSDWQFARVTHDQNLHDVIGDADVVVSNKIYLSNTVLTESQSLKLVCIAATGTNNVDLQSAADANIVVCNVRAYATASVVEHVFGVLLNLSRNLRPYRQAVDNGEWEACTRFCLLDHPIAELKGRTLGIIGYGELGQAVANMAQAFGMQVLIAEHRGTSPRAGRTDLETTLRQADVISIHCPLNPKTRNLIGNAELAQMKPGAFLIHTARGGIVDETALAQALRDGKIGGAAVDVLSEEPPVNGNPLLDKDIPNLIITPHIAWASQDARQRLIEEVAENIRGFCEGNPRNVVN